MNSKEARRLSLELMEVAEAAFFTTIDSDGFPHTRAVFNLRRKTQFPKLHKLYDDHVDDSMVYFSTNTSSSKISHIKENPKVGVYYCKPNEFRGLMLGGIIEVVTDSDQKEAIWQDGWEIIQEGFMTPTILCLG